MKQGTVHLIGNAHIDPVWLWRFPEGLAEVKATFQAAIDRIYEYDEFVFTSACAFYYKWVEENCPALFEEIRAAVSAGKWKVVGGMWIQPDCNMPSAESLARHFLYSQNYFKSRFGITVKTGYNVDSFGHAATLPKLFRSAGIENYVYMRPSQGEEKAYPFRDHAFRWQCGDSEVLAFRIHRRYAEKPRDGEVIEEYDRYASEFPYDFMLFYGVGNHGGGPTVENIEAILETRKTARNRFAFSDPDAYFDQIRENSYALLPTYTGELQNHASGCYAANAAIKRYNRLCEGRLTEWEALSVLSAHLVSEVGIGGAEKHRALWEKVMFNQFHDIICGCSQKSAYGDAYQLAGSVLSDASYGTNFSAQRISWAVNTAKGRISRNKDAAMRTVWEADGLGAPIVVFNPLSHDVTVPVSVSRFACGSVTDAEDNAVPYQLVRAEYTNHRGDTYATRFLARVPALGYATYWTYKNTDHAAMPEDALLLAEECTLRNAVCEVHFDRMTGTVDSYRVNGEERIGNYAFRAVLIDDTENDTWSHGRFSFTREVGEFGNPVFSVVESGACEVSLRVVRTHGESRLEEIYTLRPNDPRLFVHTRLFFREELKLLRLTFDCGAEDAEWIREIPGGTATAPSDGREMPMQRYELRSKNGKGIAVLNDSKYSAYAKGSLMGFTLARGCYYGDHYGTRDDRMYLQDQGEQELDYVLMPYDGDLSEVARAAAELNTVFPAIPETYHEGALPQTFGGFRCDSPQLAMTALKPAEDGNGLILRLSETAGRAVDGAEITLLGAKAEISCAPYGILTLRLHDGSFTECDLLERDKIGD